MAGNVSEIADAELIRRVIEVASFRVVRRGRATPLWSVVSNRFCLGSTYAQQLRQRFGFDPDQPVRPA